MSHFNHQANRIRLKLQQAAEADKLFHVSGAEKHQYILGDPVSLELVEQYEKEMKIQFPECYKTFVTQVGDGGLSFSSSGAGPYFGIYPFGSSYKELEYSDKNYDLRRQCLIHPNIREEEWQALIETCEKNPNISHFDGMISIGGQGCTFIHCLIMNGPYKGRVVYTSLDEHNPFFTFENNFLDWYERWLDEIISGELIEKKYFFGWTMKGTESELTTLFLHTKEEYTQIEILRSLLEKISTDATAKELILQIEKVTKDVKTEIIQVLIKHSYKFARIYLEDLIEYDALSFYKFLLWYAKDKAIEWLPLIKEEMVKITDVEVLNYCLEVIKEMGIPYSEYIIPFTNSSNDSIRRLAYIQLRDYPDKSNLLETFQKGLSDTDSHVVLFSEQALKKF